MKHSEAVGRLSLYLRWLKRTPAAECLLGGRMLDGVYGACCGDANNCSEDSIWLVGQLALLLLMSIHVGYRSALLGQVFRRVLMEERS